MEFFKSSIRNLLPPRSETVVPVNDITTHVDLVNLINSKKKVKIIERPGPDSTKLPEDTLVQQHINKPLTVVSVEPKRTNSQNESTPQVIKFKSDTPDTPDVIPLRYEIMNINPLTPANPVSHCYLPPGGGR
jgi:hypothetical protein